MTMTSDTPANLVGEVYQCPAWSSSRSSLGVSEYTSPRSSDSLLGCVTMVTMTLTRTSTTNAAPAATNAAPCPLTCSTPLLAEPNVSSERNATRTAVAVPATRPVQPAAAVIRFQNMPRMNVANSGALKNPNRVWRYVIMFGNWLAKYDVPIASRVAATVATRPKLVYQ